MPSAAVDPPARRRPPGRYDEPSRVASRAVAVVLSVLFVGFLVALSWVLFQRYSADRVPLQQRGFEVVSDRAVRVEFEVTPPADGTAWCLVRARNAAGEEVGRQVVPVAPAPGGGAVRARHELATTDRAVSGEVPRCTSTPPADAPTPAPRSP